MRARWLVLTVALASCRARSCREGSTIRADDAGTTVSREAVELCLMGVRATAQRSDRCEGGAAWWGSIDRAVEQLRPACESMAKAPGARFERAHVEACVAALATWPCGKAEPPACRVFGEKKLGAKCAFPAQCASGFCNVTSGTCGVCARIAKEGEPCEGACDADLACIEGRCHRLLADGEHCELEPCGRGSTCALVDGGLDMVCEKLHAQGEPCKSDFDCDARLRCEGSVCTPRPKPAAPGAKCANALECMDYSCVAGTCRPLAALGEACADATHPDRPLCAPSYACTHGVCTLTDASACE